ncbi:MAG: MCP four helix bundle domain-containing protein [Pseudomonadota bacterium]
MALSNLKIGTRLSLGFGIVGLLLLVITLVSISNITALNGDVDKVVNDKFPKVVKAANLIENFNLIGIAARSALIMSDKPEKMQDQFGKIMAAREKNNKNFEYLDKTVRSEDGKAALKKVKDALPKFREAQDNYIKLLNAGSFDEAKTFLVKDFRAAQHTLQEETDKLLEHQVKSLEDTGHHAEGKAKTAQTLVIALGLIALTMAVVVSFLIVRGLLKQLGGEPDYAAEVARKVAAGDLSTKIAVKEGDTSSLLAAMKSMQEMLARIVTDIKEAVDSVNTASKEIASGNADLSQRTESRLHPWRKPPPAWKNSPPPCARTPRTPSRPTSSRSAPPTSPARGAKWWARWWTP